MSLEIVEFVRARLEEAKSTAIFVDCVAMTAVLTDCEDALNAERDMRGFEIPGQPERSRVERAIYSAQGFLAFKIVSHIAKAHSHHPDYREVWR